MELFDPKIKKVFIFSQKKFFLYFWNWNICNSTKSATDLRDLFSTLRCFLHYIASPHLSQPAFIKASPGACSSSLKVSWPPTEARNTDPTHLFV